MPHILWLTPEPELPLGDGIVVPDLAGWRRERMPVYPDAAYAPFFMRYAFVETRLGCGLLKEFPRVQAWSDALLANGRVTGSVADSFEREFVASLHRRGAMTAPQFRSVPDAAD